MLVIPKANIQNEITIQINICNQALFRTWEITVQTDQNIIQRTIQEDGQKVKYRINQENNKAQTLHNCHVWQGFTMN